MARAKHHALRCLSKLGFLNGGTTRAFRAGPLLVGVGHCGGRWKAFSRIPGLHPLEAYSVPPLIGTTQSISRYPYTRGVSYKMWTCECGGCRFCPSCGSDIPRTRLSQPGIDKHGYICNPAWRKQKIPNKQFPFKPVTQHLHSLCPHSTDSGRILLTLSYKGQGTQVMS